MNRWIEWTERRERKKREKIKVDSVFLSFCERQWENGWIYKINKLSKITKCKVLDRSFICKSMICSPRTAPCPSSCILKPPSRTVTCHTAWGTSLRLWQRPWNTAGTWVNAHLLHLFKRWQSSWLIINVNIGLQLGKKCNHNAIKLAELLLSFFKCKSSFYLSCFLP